MIAEFDDPRLVAVYNAINAYGPGEQPDFYAGLASELGATTVVDLGCGTGLLTGDLARRGFTMTGIDPSSAMLAIARRAAESAPEAAPVRLIHGGVDAIGALGADFALMSGHVVQFFLTDEDWHAALTALHAALRPGGHLAFESRNPEARGWDRWNPAYARTVADPHAGPIETWSEVTDLAAGIVSYENHYVFAATGEHLVSVARLRFRTRAELTATLAATGFTVERVYGTWDRGPVEPTNPELIVVARRD